MRWLLVLLVGLLCIALTSCPKGGGDDTTGMTGNSGNSNNDSSSDEESWDE